MRLAILAILCVFSCNVAWATVYEWVDKAGVVHMTDDPDKVPAAYRKMMKTRVIDIGGESQPAPSPEGQSVGVPVPPPVEAASYGGHDERWWRAQFRKAKGDLKSLEDKIDGEKTSLEEIHRRRVLYQKPSDRVAYFELSDQIAKDEAAAKDLQKNLDDLNFRADGAGVPREWRE